MVLANSTEKKAIARDAVLNLYPTDPLEGSGRVVVLLVDRIWGGMLGAGMDGPALWLAKNW